ncbi:hypothetical protein L226DRAFT_212249 [Lentinus tigrinus ALCF2SS1-7]|uniref:SH3 domain-containing protein n=1 Tax=Lentinus tigrinus ALCF2SS1-6 TaxID=1328759 RepID=A0A5C2RYQ8_9APHY|nr:hypothetical protein L227DRAFT_281241 [Lentinus tigrinus ALCF2SS1-6]RPD70991.1 hypothetical protein L226DRAFT_212249 [Lentinus tigrinus ALCF2SS1-7]
MAMDASELGRWTRFAVKGGIRKCTAQQDCIAEHQEDLMLMKDDEILVLMQISGYVDLFLGYCEGVGGNFHGRTPCAYTRRTTQPRVESGVEKLEREDPVPACGLDDAG